MKKFKYIVVIPARAGSKRFPNKNIFLLNGKPLISHSVEYALQYFQKNDIWVNTDSDLIRKEVDNYNINIHKRPMDLGGDKISTLEVLKEQVELLISKDVNFDAVILLQPTSPLRPAKLIHDAINLFEKYGRTSLATFSALEKKYGKIIDDKFVPSNYKPGQPMQDIESEYFENGLLYITKKDAIREGFIIGKDIYPMVIDHIYAKVDIDYYDDLIFAEFLIKNKI